MSKIKIKVTPVQGKTSTHEVDATHSTVSAALKAAGISATDGLQFMVNGEPADLKQAVGQNDTITVTEKVKGS